MYPSRSLRQPQYDTNDTNNANYNPEITTVNEHQQAWLATSTLGPELGKINPLPVSMRSQTGIRGLAEAECGANFLQSTPAASRFRPVESIGPSSSITPPAQTRLQPGITTSISLGRQPTLFTKDASPKRKAAELNNVLGDPSGRLNSKAKVITFGENPKRPKSAPQSPVILLEQAKSRARVELDLLLDSGSCVEGGYVKGRVLVNVLTPNKKEGPIYLGEGKIRVVGFEAIPQNDERHTFYHCCAPFNKISPFYHMLYTSPPDDEGFCRGREENQAVPFAMRLPPRQNEFPVAKGAYNSRVNGSSIRYIAMFSIKIKDTRTNARSIAHCYRTIEVWPLFDPAIVLAPAPTPLYASTSKSLFLGGAGTVKLTASLHRATWVAGQRCYVRVFVANDNEKRGVQSLSLTLIRAETIFKPNLDAAVLSPNGTRFDNDLDACRTSTFKRIVAKSLLEMGEKVTARHATAKGWWTGVEPGTSQEFNHFILLPPFALTIPRSRLIEVNFALEVGVSTGPFASDVAIQLPIRIINNISLDPPPAFGPPEKLRNLPPMPSIIPIINEPNISNSGVKSLKLSPSVDSRSQTLAQPQPSYIFTESGTYRGDDRMPPLGKLEVRNRGSAVSGTMDGLSYSGLSHPISWAQEPPPTGLESALEESNNGHVEPRGSCLRDARASSLHVLDVTVGLNTTQWRSRDKASSLDEYLQGPMPVDTHEALLSISPGQALQTGDSSDEEVDRVMRSVNPSNFDVEEIGVERALEEHIGDEQFNCTVSTANDFVGAGHDSPTSSQQSSVEVSTMFSSRAASYMDSDASSKPASTISSRALSVLQVPKGMKPCTQGPDPVQNWKLQSPPKTRFLPQRPKPHPALASRAGDLSARAHGLLARPGKTTLRDSMYPSRVKEIASTTKQSPQIANHDRISERARRNDLPFERSVSQLKSIPDDPKHAKTLSSATASSIPTSISALMLQNLKTPVPGRSPFAHGEEGSIGIPSVQGSVESQRFGTQTVGPSTRIPTIGTGSLIKSRIAMFEQGRINPEQENARAFRTTRSAGRVHVQGMRM